MLSPHITDHTMVHQTQYTHTPAAEQQNRIKSIVLQWAWTWAYGCVNKGLISAFYFVKHTFDINWNQLKTIFVRLHRPEHRDYQERVKEEQTIIDVKTTK